MNLKEYELALARAASARDVNCMHVIAKDIIREAKELQLVAETLKSYRLEHFSVPIMAQLTAKAFDHPTNIPMGSDEFDSVARSAVWAAEALMREIDGRTG